MSTSTGGGDNDGGLFGLGNFGSGGGGNFFENVLNSALQMYTGGMVQYDPERGGIRGDIKNDVGLDIYKEISGAKAAEQVNVQAREQYEQTKADAAAARVEAQNQTAKDQMQQSRMASGARASSSATTRSTNKGTAISSVSLGADEKDFLGL